MRLSDQHQPAAPINVSPAALTLTTRLTTDSVGDTIMVRGHSAMPSP